MAGISLGLNMLLISISLYITIKGFSVGILAIKSMRK